MWNCSRLRSLARGEDPRHMDSLHLHWALFPWREVPRELQPCDVSGDHFGKLVRSSSPPASLQYTHAPRGPSSTPPSPLDSDPRDLFGILPLLSVSVYVRIAGVSFLARHMNLITFQPPRPHELWFLPETNSAIVQLLASCFSHIAHMYLADLHVDCTFWCHHYRWADEQETNGNLVFSGRTYDLIFLAPVVICCFQLIRKCYFFFVANCRG